MRAGSRCSYRLGRWMMCWMIRFSNWFSSWFSIWIRSVFHCRRWSRIWFWFWFWFIGDSAHRTIRFGAGVIIPRSRWIHMHTVFSVAIIIWLINIPIRVIKSTAICPLPSSAIAIAIGFFLIFSVKSNPTIMIMISTQWGSLYILILVMNRSQVHSQVGAVIFSLRKAHRGVTNHKVTIHKVVMITDYSRCWSRWAIRGGVGVKSLTIGRNTAKCLVWFSALIIVPLSRWIHMHTVFIISSIIWLSTVPIGVIPRCPITPRKIITPALILARRPNPAITTHRQRSSIFTVIVDRRQVHSLRRAVILCFMPAISGRTRMKLLRGRRRDSFRAHSIPDTKQPNHYRHRHDSPQTKCCKGGHIGPI